MNFAELLVGEVLGDRRPELAVRLDAEPGQPLGLELLDELGQLVDQLAAVERGPAGGVDAADLLARVGRLAEDAEIDGRRDVGAVDQLAAEAQVGRVVAEPLHRLVPGHPRQRQLQVQAEELLRQPLHQAVDHADHVVVRDERHFQVELRELRLAVGPQVFVAKAAGDLHVAVVAGDHQNLLVELRRLRQGIEQAVVHAAGHEIVAGPFRRAAAEDRRFDVEEVVLGEVVPHLQDDVVAQHQRPLHLGPPQIEIAILQPQVLAGQLHRRREERGVVALVEQLQLLRPQLDLARVELGVGRALGPMGDLARDADHVLGPQLARLGQHLPARLRDRRRPASCRSGRGGR